LVQSNNQTINPAYSPNFDIGFNYSAEDTGYNSALSWLHLDTSDSASKQAKQSIQNAIVEFVGPSYDVGPLVFGIKHAESTVKFAFDSILINAGRSIQPLPHLRINVFGGLDLLRIKQTITTVFGDYQGAEPTAYSYGLPADPAFSFQTQNVSTYLGIGPDLGLDARYQRDNGLGVAGSFLGTVTVGSVSSKDSFKSTSARLNLLGVNPSQQFLILQRRLFQQEPWLLTQLNPKPIRSPSMGLMSVLRHYSINRYCLSLFVSKPGMHIISRWSWALSCVRT
jgi:hypothetical protein